MKQTKKRAGTAVAASPLPSHLFLPAVMGSGLGFPALSCESDSPMRGTLGGGPIGTAGAVGAGLLGCGGGCCSAFFFCSRFSTCFRASNSCTQGRNKEEEKKKKTQRTR